MFILLVLALALVLGMIRGGKLSNLADLHFRWQILILTGFLIQILIFQPYWQDRAETRALTPIAYLLSLCLLIVALAVNYKIPGMSIIAMGFFSNFIAIALNGGYMPASPTAQQIAGHHVLAAGEIYNNSIGLGPDTRLPFLGDILAIPQGIPFANVFSIGDILIAIGGVYLILQTMQTSPGKAKKVF